VTISSLRDAPKRTRRCAVVQSTYLTAIATQMLEQSVVVSQNYLPLCQVNIKRAMMLLVTNKSQALSFVIQGGWLHSPSLVIEAPKHIRLTIATNERMWKVWRRNNHSCQYFTVSEAWRDRATQFWINVQADLE
jgi:hypothetical protein